MHGAERYYTKNNIMPLPYGTQLEIKVYWGYNTAPMNMAALYISTTTATTKTVLGFFKGQ